MIPRRVLITGGSGYLGAALFRHIQKVRPAWQVHATYFSKPLQSPYAHFLDLRNPDSISSVIQASQPELIFHTAAQMSGPLEILRAVNLKGTEILASLARETGARVIHLSTDMVFDGRRGNYREEDTPNPITPYGQSKLEGERAVLASGAEVVIVRTSLIYGLNPLDPRTLAVLDGTMPRLFVDEKRCPIEVENLCEALIELGESPYAGVLNVVGPQAQSRYEFGIKLTRALGSDETKLIALRSDESGLIRPKDCTLSLDRARQVLKTRLRSVDEVLGGQRGL